MSFPDDPDHYRLNLGKVPEGAHLDVLSMMLRVCEEGSAGQAAGIAAYAGRASADTAKTLAHTLQHVAPETKAVARPPTRNLPSGP